MCHRNPVQRLPHHQLDYLIFNGWDSKRSFVSVWLRYKDSFIRISINGVSGDSGRGINFPVFGSTIKSIASKGYLTQQNSCSRRFHHAFYHCLSAQNLAINSSRDLSPLFRVVCITGGNESTFGESYSLTIFFRKPNSKTELLL